MAGKLGALLTSLNFPEIPAAYAALPIHAAYVDRDVLTIRSDSRILACRLNEKSIAPDELSSHFEFAYVNGDGVVQQSALALYDAAFAAAGKFYVFKGNEYVELATVPATIAEIQWQAPRKIADKWSIGKIDAAFTQGEKVYVFSGDRYAKLQNGQEPNALTDFQHIQGNWGNLPYELRSGMDAAFERADALYLFKGDQYIKYAKGDAADETAIPYEIWDAKYKIVRLTTSTAYKLNQKLFAGGVTALLNIATQEIDELPSFSEDESTPTTIKVRGGKVDAQALPVSSHLDFNSANGIYYWEVFFHAPFLIAQSLSSGQKFAEAKEWYEYIFDPTELVDYWKFLPFLAVDVQALINSYHSYLTQLQELKSAIAPVEGDFTQLFTMLEEKAVGGKSIVQVFRQLRRLPPDEETALYQQINALSTVLTSLRQHVQALLVLPEVEKNPRAKRIVMSLAERTEIIGKLGYRYELIGDHAAQIQTFLDDPFDPHAIAALRPLAYRKAIVMGYVDNLLNWGDLLFRQYTRESIDEARMLYILAYDLLGEKPENLGVKILSATQDYSHLRNDSPGYEIELYIDDGKEVATHPVAVLQATPHKSVATPYFFIPENSLFGDYWTRVEDRLYKIRASLNILGISQPLPLFEPPIDPLALVQAVSAGASVSSALASMNIPVPHYRFLFMLRKAQELVQKLNGFGNDLLAVLEKKDAEALNLLQNRQEAVILGMTRSIKEAQLNAAAETIDELEQSLQAANSRISHYERLQSAGLLPTEIAQIALMAAAAAAHSVSSGLRIAASFGSAAPDSLVGPFIAGVKYGGSNAGNSLSSAAEVAESLGEGLSVTGEILGVLANYERTAEDWDLQLALAQSDVIQIGHQLEGARLQHKIAQRELEILEQEIAHNEAIKTFMKDKFANAQLYQWMAGKLSGMYFQTYNLAYEMAKAAEKAFQFEQGLKESEVNYIQPLFWDSQKNGLLAGESLGLDLDRMEKAYYDSNRRSFEITKNISLLELDPVAFLQLKSKGVCEFALTEALFDYDFPGHYCRQIKTLSLTFHAAEGQRVDVNATLTQLNHKTVLEPDAKAVKYLLDPKDQPPLSLRSGWKANQQIALSYIADDYEKNNGLFELRFDDDRYLPFEGTGAVSTWRLELNGKKGSYNVNDLVDVTMTLQYTAEQGGALFANTVKGMLKPYPTARFFDVAQEFPDEWEEFMAGDDTELVLTFTRAMFPNLSSSKITGILARYELLAPGPLTMMLQEADDLILRDGKYLLTTGLSINSQGSEWTFTVNGDKSQLKNVNLVLGYKAM